jgi:hypothetical protein
VKDPVTGQTTDSADLSRVQDRDLQDLANALWLSGAEAVSINAQRLAPTSAIRSAGGAILVDFRPLTSPYLVQAVGDPKRLRSRFDGSASARRFRGYVKQYGMRYAVRTSGDLRLPAAPAPDLRYAAPAPEPSAGSPSGSSTASSGSSNSSPGSSNSSPSSPNQPTRSPTSFQGPGSAELGAPVPSAPGGDR